MVVVCAQNQVKEIAGSLQQVFEIGKGKVGNGKVEII